MRQWIYSKPDGTAIEIKGVPEAVHKNSCANDWHKQCAQGMIPSVFSPSFMRCLKHHFKLFLYGLL